MPALSGGCRAEVLLPEFAGTWLLKYQNRNFLELSLRIDNSANNQLTGALVRPEHFAYDSDGDFTNITPQQIEETVSGVSLSEEQLGFSTGTGNSRTSFAISLIDRDHAVLRMFDAPVPLPPWRLQRAGTSEDVRLATDWPDQRPRSRRIAALQAQLKRMADADQSVRTAVPLSEARMREVDRANLPQLLRIRRKFGWLKRSAIGKEAAGRFWLLVQHQDLSLQRKVLPEMQWAVAAGEASQSNYVLLYDRVMIREGKPQHWGIQTSCVNGEAVLDPVDDPAGLERRRDELYLQPLGAYLKSMSEACRNFVHDLPANK